MEVVIRIICKEEELWTRHEFVVTKDDHFYGFDLDGFSFDVPVSEVLSVSYMLSPGSSGKECDCCEKEN